VSNGTVFPVRYDAVDARFELELRPAGGDDDVMTAIALLSAGERVVVEGTLEPNGDGAGAPALNLTRLRPLPHGSASTASILLRLARVVAVLSFLAALDASFRLQSGVAIGVVVLLVSLLQRRRKTDLRAELGLGFVAQCVVSAARFLGRTVWLAVFDDRRPQPLPTYHPDDIFEFDRDVAAPGCLPPVWVRE
jgi:hypothetical protein